MTWLAPLLPYLAGAGWSVAAVLLFLLWWRGRKLDAANVRAGFNMKQAEHVAEQFRQEQRQRHDDKTRLELVIMRMRAELETLETELSVCSAQLPGSVRTRLARLLDPNGIPGP